ncbi:MAG: cupin domain-containing protein, partial [Gammaproteobacteria bacterium]|nr:cupin domain-containing protein [Gammaproteobacteria bacterium]
WRLGGHVDSTSTLLPNTDLRLLQTFNTEEDWIVEPGDILYLPPNIAHHGVAIGDSITYSIGFRTPSVAEIIDDLGSELIQELAEEERYVDTSPQIPQRPGEIDPQISTQLVELLQKHLLDNDKLTRWFGRYMTSPKYAELVTPTEEALCSNQLRQHLCSGMLLIRNPASRFAFADNQTGAELYVDGTTIPCPPELTDLLPTLCDTHAADPDWQALLNADEESAILVTRLYNQGSLLLDDGSEE